MVKQGLIAETASRFARDRRAAAAAEFALITPLFLLMMCGTLQYGVLFYTWNVALNGARNAARALAVGKVDVAGAENMMINALPAWVTAERAPDGEQQPECEVDDEDCDVVDAPAEPVDSGIDATATDAVVGGDVTAVITFPSSRATFLPLAPMPANVSVTVHMVKEA